MPFITKKNQERKKSITPLKISHEETKATRSEINGVGMVFEIPNQNLIFRISNFLFKWFFRDLQLRFGERRGLRV